MSDLKDRIKNLKNKPAPKLEEKSDGAILAFFGAAIIGVIAFLVGRKK